MGIVHHTEEEDHDKILDSRLTITLSKDKNLFSGLRNVKGKVTMRTNTGAKAIQQEGRYKGWGRTYYVPFAITNIVSTSDAIKKGYRVIMDSAKANCFYLIDRNGMTVKFPCVGGLYVRGPGKPVDYRELGAELSLNTESKASPNER